MREAVKGAVDDRLLPQRRGATNPETALEVEGDAAVPVHRRRSRGIADGEVGDPDGLRGRVHPEGGIATNEDVTVEGGLGRVGIAGDLAGGSRGIGHDRLDVQRASVDDDVLTVEHLADSTAGARVRHADVGGAFVQHDRRSDAGVNAVNLKLTGTELGEALSRVDLGLNDGRATVVDEGFTRSGRTEIEGHRGNHSGGDCAGIVDRAARHDQATTFESDGIVHSCGANVECPDSHCISSRVSCQGSCGSDIHDVPCDHAA